MQYIHRVLHKTFDGAMTWDLIVLNPCDLVDVLRARRPEVRTLKEEPVIRLLLAPREDPLEALFALAVTTAMYFLACRRRRFPG